MPPKRRPPPDLYGPLGPNGEMQFPPLKPWAEREKERLEAIEIEKSKNKLQKGKQFEIPDFPETQILATRLVLLIVVRCCIVVRCSITPISIQSYSDAVLGRRSTYISQFAV